MSLVARNDAGSLASELATARQKYVDKRNAILNRVKQRRSAVAETITDLQAEDQELAKVEEQAGGSA